MLVLIWKLFQKKTVEKQKKPKKPIQQNKEPTVYKSPPQSIYKKKKMQDLVSGDIQSSKQGLYLKQWCERKKFLICILYGACGVLV